MAPTDQELAEHESSLSQDDLVKVEGTKVGQRQTQLKLEAEKFLVVRLATRRVCGTFLFWAFYISALSWYGNETYSTIYNVLLFWAGMGMRHILLCWEWDVPYYDIQVVLNRAVVEHANDVRRKSLLLKFPKDRVKKRRRQGDEELDYLEKRTKSANRRRTNPEVRRIIESCHLWPVRLQKNTSFF